jgi:uncharacterized protein YciW
MVDENVTLDAAGVPPGSKLAEVVAGRADIMALTQATMEAVLAPQAPGGISSAERTAFACRIARLNDEQALAEHFARLMAEVGAPLVQLADPSFVGNGDVRVGALIHHVDLVTLSPKDATEEDIAALKRAAISEADIVRLAEIIAFVNYQVRVIAGLRLLGEMA